VGVPGPWRGLLLVAIGVVLVLLAGGDARGQDADAGAVHLLSLTGSVDRGDGPFVRRALDDAEDDGAEALLLTFDTPGGRLDAALAIADELLDRDLRTIALVDTATGPAALAATAAEELHLTPAGRLGAGDPRDPATGGAGVDDRDVIEEVASRAGEAARARGREPTVATAMVDPTVTIGSVVDATRLLQLDAGTAAELGYADGEGGATRAEELLVELDLGERPLEDVRPRRSELVVPALTTPVVASALVTTGLMLLLFEVFVGAFGLVSLAGVALLSAFFYGHLLAGLAGWEDVLLVLVGLGLIALELFVVPGFGIAGVLGLSSLFAGAWSAMVGGDLSIVSTGQLVSTGATIVIAFIAITFGLVVLLTLLSRRNAGDSDRQRKSSGWLRWFGDGDVLEQDEDAPTGPPVADPHEPPGGPGTPLSAAASAAAHQGAIGTALSDLRPAGVADFGGYRVDVVTLGDYLEAGERVEIVRAERYRRVVRRARS
jgi:membrane-bound serine protease (ClpP class)